MDFEVPHFDKIVDAPEEDEEEFYNSVDRFYQAIQNTKIEGFEREKSERDIKILAMVNQSIDEYLSQYEKERIIEPPLSKIHIFEKGGVEKFTKGIAYGGAHAPLYGSVFLEREKSDVAFALTAFHELFHLKVYNALQLTKPTGEEKIRPETYRSGFIVTSRDGNKKYFEDIEEALTEIMTERFYREKVLTSDLFKDENSHKPEVKFTREKERKKFNELVDDLWDKNKDEFPDREDIVSLFLDGQVNGRILQVGKLIEKTFGPGSLRRLGRGDVITQSEK
jgi:hypothetical protein